VCEIHGVKTHNETIYLHLYFERKHKGGGVVRAEIMVSKKRIVRIEEVRSGVLEEVNSKRGEGEVCLSGRKGGGKERQMKGPYLEKRAFPASKKGTTLKEEGRPGGKKESHPSITEHEDWRLALRGGKERDTGFREGGLEHCIINKGRSLEKIEGQFDRVGKKTDWKTKPN